MLWEIRGGDHRAKTATEEFSVFELCQRTCGDGSTSCLRKHPISRDVTYAVFILLRGIFLQLANRAV